MIGGHQIKLERWKTNRDASGNNTETIMNAWYLWADVQRVGGGRTTKYGVTALDNSMEFRIRFRPNIWATGNYRIIYDGKRFTIQSIVKDEEKKFDWILLANATGKK